MSREGKILNFINDYLTYDKVDSDYNSFHSSLRSRFHNMLDFYNIFWDMRMKGNKDYKSSPEFVIAFEITLGKVFNKYGPKVTPEQAKEKEIEVNGVNKRGIKTGKRTVMKFGRWVGQAFPFLTDIEKENLGDWYYDNYGPIDATFHRATTGFEGIVTKRMGKRVGFSTTMWQKSLADSCMRYETSELGLTEHPYSAYESGDWELCYLLNQDGYLLGRCLVNLPTKTHSAIYGVSRRSIDMLKEEMHKLGYTQVSEDAAEWDGSRLKYIEDNFCSEYEDMSVFLMPYIDVFNGYAYHDRKYIYLSVSSDRPKGTCYVDPFESGGYNEI